MRFQFHRAGGGAFTPAQRSGGLLWLRGDAGVTLDTGNVTNWACQYGSGNDVSATGAARPTMTTENGIACPTFNGTDQYLGNDAATTPFTYPSTWYMVVRMTNDESVNNVLYAGGGGTDSSVRLGYQVLGGDASVVEGPDANLLFASITSNQLTKTCVVWGDGDDTDVYSNGDFTTPYISGPLGPLDGDALLRVGVHYWDGHWFTGAICEIIVVTGKDSLAQRQQMLQWLSRWNA